MQPRKPPGLVSLGGFLLRVREHSRASSASRGQKEARNERRRPREARCCATEALSEAEKSSQSLRLKSFIDEAVKGRSGLPDYFL